MATGGTIPKNRTQTVSFYNTTSIIEKQKNIYYVPRFSKTSATVGQEVRIAYLNAFEVVCPPSSVYDDVDVSSWSPQDRTLTVKGNVDNFRLVTDEGACLNYFIITRKVYSSELEFKVYYYAFFITGVEQIGGSSVRLTIEPDDFTNVFYLHNKHVLTSSDINWDYEPFNEKMTNCYVNRQHYNRVKYAEGDWINSETHVINPIGNETFTVTLQGDKPFWRETVEVQYSIIGGGSGNATIISVSGRQVLIQFQGGGPGTSFVNIYARAKEKIIKIDNQKIFLNTEESFRFKYQYRSQRRPLTALSDSEYEEVMSASTFADLSNDEKIAVVKASISYFVIEAKSKDIGGYVCIDRSAITGDNYNYGASFLYNNPLYKKGLRYTSPQYIIPYIDVPEQFLKFKDAINAYSLYLNVHYRIVNTNYQIQVSTIDILGRTWETLLTNMLHSNNIDNHIFNIYIVRDMCIGDIISVVPASSKIIFDVYSNTMPDNQLTSASADRDYQNDIDKVYLVSIVNSEANVGNKDGKTIAQAMNTASTITYSTQSSASLSSLGAIPALIKSGLYNKKYHLNFSNVTTAPKTYYFDPVLEAEPYTFYSVSYLSYEFALNKNRYYETESLDIEYIITINGAVKMSYLPIYTVESYQQRYLNEGMTFTLSGFIPLVSDSYLSYFYQNMAQMKNQYAVNNFNRGVDLAQHLLVSGPNAVGYHAGKGGFGEGSSAGTNALLETANQVMQMIDEGIDWAQSDKVIEMNQKAKLADMGRRPDVYSQTGSDVYYDIGLCENLMLINKYKIDTLSYNSIAKMLERAGYQVNLYDSLKVVNRVGWNFIKLNGFDFKPTTDIMTSQENSIRRIFSEGVTLLHDKTYLTSGHNYETILED